MKRESTAFLALRLESTPCPHRCRDSKQQHSTTSISATCKTQVRQDITLEVAAAGTAIEVTATADTALRESSASIGDVLTQERAQELPLVGANILDLMQVMPGMKTGNFTVVGSFDTDTFAFGPTTIRHQPIRRPA